MDKSSDEKPSDEKPSEHRNYRTRNSDYEARDRILENENDLYEMLQDWRMRKRIRRSFKEALKWVLPLLSVASALFAALISGMAHLKEAVARWLQ